MTSSARLAACAYGFLAVAASVLAVPGAAYADPPPWAPAHGWRRQHDPYYVGYTGRKWDNDYGIISGRCNRQAVGAVVGAAVGGAVGSQVGKGNGKTVATVLGAVIGGAVGAKIGGELDAGDRACIGHALELSKDNERVTWTNPDTGVNYLLSPTRGYKQGERVCRDFTLKTNAGRQDQTNRGTACQAADGAWQMAN